MNERNTVAVMLAVTLVVVAMGLTLSGIEVGHGCGATYEWLCW